LFRDHRAQYLSTHAPITVLYRPPKQAWLQAMIEAGRARAQLHLAAADLSGVRSLLKALKRGEAVGMLPDQAPKAGEGRWLDFFGKPAYTMTLAARLVESGASVIMVWAERLPGGAGYHFHLQAPTQPIRGTIEERAQQINHEIEVLVRQCPQQYLWGYNRYKGRRAAKRCRLPKEADGGVMIWQRDCCARPAPLPPARMVLDADRLLSLQVLSLRRPAARFSAHRAGLPGARPRIRVYTLEWRGDVPAGFEVVLVPVSALTNQRRYAKFSTGSESSGGHPADRVVGFNKMPGLDVYFAADPCFEDKARTLRSPLYRLSGRYRHFAAYERAVFGATADRDPDDLAAAKAAVPEVLRHADERFHLLPPGIAPTGGRRQCAESGPLSGASSRWPGDDSCSAADRLGLQDQGSGPQPEGAGRAAASARQALPTDRHRRR
jgi:hypothetical protein